MRCINVVNFIRGVEPRFKTDLLLPVQKQMELILGHKLPATWLLQYDALVTGDFVAYLKAQMAKNHEVGFWFEMNEELCRAAKVEWRGRPGFEWDHLPPVAFTIGYTQDERIKLADAAMAQFKRIWGKHPKSVASWNLDAFTIGHLVDKYGVDAFAVCRDQIATDGFMIWGAPIAGYYPSKQNCWSPALSRENQIEAPIFRMLGQDPVHYYSARYKLPDGRITSEPDTMEPVWASGRSEHFNRAFLDMIARDECLQFAYAQLGQENSFPWPDQAAAYPMQMQLLAELRDAGKIHVETMGDSGRRFKKAFKQTPTQAQVMLEDPFGKMDPAESTIWYQSRFYRANLHIKGGVPYFRDITVYSDEFPQPYLDKATRLNDVEQRMPAVLDGFHWSKDPMSLEEVGAGGIFEVEGKRISTQKPTVVEDGKDLRVALTPGNGASLEVRFDEKGIKLKGASLKDLALSFEWDSSKAALRDIQPRQATYQWQGHAYRAKLVKGRAVATDQGWKIESEHDEIDVRLDQ